MEVANLKELKYPIGAEIKINSALIKRMYRALKPYLLKDKLNNFWCTGSSGNIIASYCCLRALREGYPARISSLNGKSIHRSNPYPKLASINIVVDDFVCTGKTIREITDSILHKKGELDILCVTGELHTRFISDKFKTVIARKVV